jgi:hypothetical protein
LSIRPPPIQLPHVARLPANPQDSNQTDIRNVRSQVHPMLQDIPDYISPLAVSYSEENFSEYKRNSVAYFHQMEFEITSLITPLHSHNYQHQRTGFVIW